MNGAAPEPDPERRPSRTSLTAAIVGAVCVAALLFYLLDLGSGGGPGSGSITLTLLLLVPAILSAVTSLITDPKGDRGLGHYLFVPLILLLCILVAGALFLHEGVICILLLAPLWGMAGLAGSGLAYLVRKRLRERGRLFVSGLLLLPLGAVQIEAALPPETVWNSVRREVIVHVPPERVWPLLVAIPAIDVDEGQWNLTHDLLGVPRPRSAALRVQGGDIVRLAQWERGVRFEERITGWEPGRRLHWRFAFPDRSVQEHTDRHISPNGGNLKIAAGTYELTPTANGGTRVLLETRYALKTPLNTYASWWGELLLGDIQDNVLMIVKQRAEASQRSGSTNATRP